MHLEETPEQLALRAELRAYFAQLLTPEVRHALDTETEGGETFRAVVRQMGKDGWLGIGWPIEFGGQGRPATDQFIFFTEVQRARAPFMRVPVSSGFSGWQGIPAGLSTTARLASSKTTSNFTAASARSRGESPSKSSITTSMPWRNSVPLRTDRPATFTLPERINSRTWRIE